MVSFISPCYLSLVDTLFPSFIQIFWSIANHSLKTLTLTIIHLIIIFLPKIAWNIKNFNSKIFALLFITNLLIQAILAIESEILHNKVFF